MSATIRRPGPKQLGTGEVQLVREMRARGIPARQVAESFGLSTRQVARIVAGTAWPQVKPAATGGSKIERFMLDPGWANCPPTVRGVWCECWAEERPEDHCTNAVYKARMLTMLASAAPGTSPAELNRRV